MPAVRIDNRALRDIARGRQAAVFMGDVVRRATNFAVREAPVDEGRLRSSINGRVIRAGGGIRGEIRADVSYAATVVNGYRASNVRVSSHIRRGSAVVPHTRLRRARSGNNFLLRGVRRALR